MQNLPPLKIAGGPIKKGRTGNIQVSWDPDIPVEVTAFVCVPVEEDLLDIAMNYKRTFTFKT